MTIADRSFARSDMAVQEEGFTALIRTLGYADALRFVVRLSSGQRDYLQWQDRVFEGQSVQETYERARKHWVDRET